MPSTINERISYLIDLLDLSKNAFAKKLGTSSTRISNITTGRNKPDSDILARIKNTFEVNGNWLLDGEGDVFNESKYLRFDGNIVQKSHPGPEGSKEKIKAIIREIGRSQKGPFTELPQNWGKDEGEGDRKAKSQSTQKQIQSVPKSTDHFEKENIAFVSVREQVEYLVKHSNPHYVKRLPSFAISVFQNDLFRAFEVEGNGMLMFNGLGLHQGDIVIASFIEKTEEINDDNIYVIVSKKGILIKRCINKLGSDSKLICISDNPGDNFSPILLSKNEISEVWEFKAKISSWAPKNNILIEDMTELRAQLASISNRLSIVENFTGKKS